MNNKEQLIRLRTEIKRLTYKLNTLPAILRSEGMDNEVNILKEKERELIKKMSDEELYGAEMAANQMAQQSGLANRLKSQKTLVIAGGVSAFLIVAIIIGGIIYKKSKK